MRGLRAGGARAFELGYDGPWAGPAAARLVREQQQIMFDWVARPARSRIRVG
ncbi:MAG: hypothetical protein ABIS14_09875 [Sphingomonas sp.]